MFRSVNPIISNTLLYKGWNGLSGLIGLPFIIYFLDPVTQGLYYTFLSIIAVQGFVELGISILLVVFASHEWVVIDGADYSDSSKLNVAKSRLKHLTLFALKYFGLGAIIFVLVALIYGQYIMGGIDQSLWLYPWVIHVLAAGLIIWLTPILSIYEGCGNVAQSSLFKFFISFVGSIGLIVALFFNFGIWALPISALLQFFVLVLILRKLLVGFFPLFWVKDSKYRVSWTDEILPLQWRLGVQALVGYFSFPFFISLAFKVIGPEEAGQLGMSIQIIAGMQVLGLVFITSRMAELSSIASDESQSNKFFDFWRRISKHSLYATSFFLASAVVAIMFGSALYPNLSTRLIPVSQVFLFSIGVLLMLVPQSIAIFFRAKKIEKFTSVGVVTGVAMGVISIILSEHLGLMGFAITYLLVSASITVPFSIFVYYRNKHSVMV